MEIDEKIKYWLDLSDDQKDFIDLLEPLNIEAMYPSYKDKLQKALNKEKCSDILTKTKGFQKWIKKKLLKKWKNMRKR